MTLDVSKFLKSKLGIAFCKTISDWDPPQRIAPSLSNASGNIPLEMNPSRVFSRGKRGHIDRNMCFCAGDGVDQLTAKELTIMHTAITTNLRWQVCDAVDEPMLIVSVEAPHLILKSSLVWNNIMGYTSQQMFGHSLDHFVCSTCHLQNAVERGGGSGHKYSGSAAKRKSPLLEFYEAMRKERAAHVVTELVDSCGEAILFSIHCYGISGYNQVSVSVGGLDGDNDEPCISRRSSLESCR